MAGVEEKKKKKFITSALPYVNNQPHLGNIVGSVLSADVYARFCRKMGYDTLYVSGTDEFGTAIEMEAVRQNVHPSVVVERNRVLHRAVYDWFLIEFDHFGHTNSCAHIELTRQIFRECWDNGYFSEEEVEQFFCGRCEQFLADRYVEGRCGFCGYDSARGDQCDRCGKCLQMRDLGAPRCVLCGTEPLLRTDSHLFLRLDLLKTRVERYFESIHRGWTSNAQSIYQSWISRELRPRSMTRSLRSAWGVPVPLEKYKDKVFYVWFDAPIGYFSFLSESRRRTSRSVNNDNSSNRMANSRNWQWREWARDAELVQFMGKDNVPFHSLIFPAIIMAASADKGLDAKDILPEPAYPIVSRISSTEYLMYYGEKFSKSRKVGIFGMDLVENDLGCPDFWRFFLMRERPETKDADFCVDKFIELVMGDLVANWGNFCNRTLKYIKKQLGGVVEVKELDEEDRLLVGRVNRLFEGYKELMESMRIREALDKALETSSVGNKYLQDLQTKDKSRLRKGFAVAYSLVVLLAHMFEPFTPSSSKRAFRMCGVGEDDTGFPEKFQVIMNAKLYGEIEVIFDKWTDSQKENLRKYIPASKK